jgi:hypothetical protein
VSSPVHYVTYVYVYGSSPRVVYVGYLPGYFGSYVSPDGVVVYGTGYYYRPWIGAYWFGHPWTFGFGVGWSSTWGWGFHPGYFYHPWWGPWRGYAWHGYGPGVYHPNFYHSWNQSYVHNTAFHGANPNRFAAHREGPGMRNNVYADHKGNVFRHNEKKGWEKYDNHAWKSAGQASEKGKTEEVEHERVARAQGEKRTANYRQTSNSSGHKKGRQR